MSVKYISRAKFKELLKDPKFVRFGANGQGRYANEDVMYVVKRGVE